MTAFRPSLITMFFVLTVFVIGYFDFYILTPLLPFPDDICFYHTNPPPPFVKLFYLDSSGHVEPPFSGLHILTLFAASLATSIYLAFRTDKLLKGRAHKPNEYTNGEKNNAL
jgi:hypothetical protein